jgi:iron complex outermembrane receptor protein
MTADEYRAYGNKLGVEYTDEGYNTDWQNAIYRTGISNNESVAIAGGVNNSSYRASITNTGLQGVVENSSKNRTIMRLNAQTKGLNEKLNLAVSLANTIEKNNYINYGSSGADGALYQAFQRNPTIPIYNDDGSYYQSATPPVNNYSNPVAIINDIQNEREAKRLLANVKADLEIIDGLIFSVNGAYTRDDDESWYFEPASNGPLNGEGKGSRSYNNNYSYLLEGFLNYTKQFNEHNLNLLGGYSFQEMGWDGFSAYGENPSSDFFQANNLGSLSKVNPGDISSWKGSNRTISGFGRVVYNYNQKYFVTGTLRRDGSSKFGENNQWGLFPSGSVKWDITRESFMSAVPVISQLQLRVGYGQTGNQDIGTYKDIALFGITDHVQDATTGETTVVYGSIQNANPDLKWEVNTELNVGLDFALFKSRLNGSIDVYNKKTTDLLYTYNVNSPPYLYDQLLVNAGAIDVNGIEAVLSGYIIDKTKLKWKSTFVISHDESIVTATGNKEFPGDKYVLEGYLMEPLGYGTSTQVLMEGYQRGTWYGPKFAGIDQNTGDFLYEMADGTLDTKDKVDVEDYQILGNSQPKLEIGFSNYIKLYNNWDINFTFRGMFGHKILNATNMVFDNPNYFPTRNVLSTAPERTEITEESFFSDYWLEDGGFLRLENITIGYNFNVKNSRLFKQARAYIAGNNLFTITKYSGIDPSAIGIDIFNVYPKTTSFTVGFNLVF